MISYDRTVCESDGISKRTEHVRREVAIPRGSDAGEIRIKQEGNQEFGFPNSDICVEVKVNCPGRFVRAGNDLFVVHEISLKNALLAKPFELVV